MGNFKLRVQVNNKWYTVDIEDLNERPIRATVNGETVLVEVDSVTEADHLFTDQSSDSLSSTTTPDPVSDTSASGKVFYCPMAGIIVSVAVSTGDQVITGDEICILEAMKMQQHLRADWSGIVKTVFAEPGQHVSLGDPLVELK